MNKQRKVVITTTYNEMGIIIDTKAEELGTSAQLGTDCISRQAAIDLTIGLSNDSVDFVRAGIKALPPAQPEIIPCDYVKACNEATNYKTISAVSYLEVLEELKKHGYVLVNTIKER